MPAAEFLAFKIVATLTVVLGIAWITERFGPRAGAIASGFPNTMALILLFNGLAFGEEFVLAAIPAGLAGLTAPLAFGTAWGLSAKLPFSLLLSPFIAFTVYAVTAFGLSIFSFNLFTALILIIPTMFLFHYFNQIFPKKNIDVKSVNGYELAFRIMIVLIVVLSITEISRFSGPKFSGVLAAFPANVLPLFFILHRRYGGEAVQSFLVHWPLKLASIVGYLLAFYFLMPFLPFFGAWLLAMTASITISVFFVIKQTILSHLYNPYEKNK